MLMSWTHAAKNGCWSIEAHVEVDKQDDKPYDVRASY